MREFRYLVLVVALVLACDVVFGQCAMCGAVADEASEENAGVGIGLNRGILFLMAIPYCIFGVIAWVFFKDNIKRLFKKSSAV